MKIVLRRDVPDLGKAGDLKDVADGFARNYLIPRGFAVAATANAVAQIEAKRGAEQRQHARIDEERRALARTLEGSRVVVRAKAGGRGRLHGSVTAIQIAEALSAALGQVVDRREIEIGDPIRQVGEHEVSVRLARNVSAKVKLVVEAEE
ncbi:MAG: 50S ribosomal protein L9 [Chloroflexi bacterium]|nr:50S ribosomal protein L9 [Chloroflexota bacterium]